jgi:hypothetical protein
MSKFAQVLAVVMAFIPGLAGGAIGATSAEEGPPSVKADNGTIWFDQGFTPKRVGRYEPSPVAEELSIHFGGDAAAQPGLKAFAIGFDRSHQIDLSGLPSCNPTMQIPHTEDWQRLCGRAVFAKGVGGVVVRFPEQPPQFLTGPLVLLKAGTTGAATRVDARLLLPAPVSGALLLRGELRRPARGDYGAILELTVPKLAAGSGSVVSFTARLPRDLMIEGKDEHPVELICPKGRIATRAWVTLSDGETATEESIRACTPSG